MLITYIWYVIFLNIIFFSKKAMIFSLGKLIKFFVYFVPIFFIFFKKLLKTCLLIGFM